MTQNHERDDAIADTNEEDKQFYLPYKSGRSDLLEEIFHMARGPERDHLIRCYQACVERIKLKT